MTLFHTYSMSLRTMKSSSHQFSPARKMNDMSLMARQNWDFGRRVDFYMKNTQSF